MDLVRWEHRPELDRPVLVTAFAGWNDAGEAASTAVRWLAERWEARVFAEVDPEEFYDFTATRPMVELIDGETRVIHWPANEVAATREPRDALVLVGVEPQLRWRTFCEAVVGIARELDVSQVVTLGALLAEIPHNVPTPVVGAAHDPSMVESLGLERSTYEGPTGIVGVLHAACQDAGIPSASLWAAVPTYVPSAASPKAALALVRAVTDLLSVGAVTTDLEIAAADYERQVDELVDDDDELADYVRGLIEEVATQIDGEDPLAGRRLIEEVERFLRDQR